MQQYWRLSTLLSIQSLYRLEQYVAEYIQLEYIWLNVYGISHDNKGHTLGYTGCKAADCIPATEQC